MYTLLKASLPIQSLVSELQNPPQFENSVTSKCRHSITARLLPREKKLKRFLHKREQIFSCLCYQNSETINQTLANLEALTRVNPPPRSSRVSTKNNHYHVRVLKRVLNF